MKNTWFAKIYRNLLAFLPVSKKRRGECIRCGECCKLPNVCPFLRYNDKNEPRCIIYPIRSWSCRRYPRTAREHITKDTCGYWFEDSSKAEVKEHPDDSILK
ncbi:MAG: hypothetical protein ACTSRK_06995 [Promethearchaeota archaeon]